MSAGHRLTAEQFGLDENPTVLRWPFVLRGPEYADFRLKFDRCFPQNPHDP